MHLDKNPAYNLTIPLVLRVFPETRLIVALRDPRDVVLSCYLRYLPLNAVSVRFLDVRRTAERYALDMSAWLKFRELIETPWCEVRYEDTVANLESQARRALETLGLPVERQVLAYRERLAARQARDQPDLRGGRPADLHQRDRPVAELRQTLEPALEMLAVRARVWVRGLTAAELKFDQRSLHARGPAWLRRVAPRRRALASRGVRRRGRRRA